jgi:L-alanine-DL-glutamate epimerase-like enolase superfamily enzyme
MARGEGMPSSIVSRRDFFGASALRAMAGAGAVALADPSVAASQAVGIKPSDLPDLTIKQVKVYVIDAGGKEGAGANGLDHIAAIVTESGIEGNYTLGERYWHPNWNNQGWLEYAKSMLPGKSVLDLPALTSQWTPVKRRVGQLSYASAIDNCLWDILGKAVGLPIYQILGAYRNRVLAYASSQHHDTLEEFVTEVQQCKAQGFKAYKIHPPWEPGRNGEYKHDYHLDMEVAKAVRKVAGDDFLLLMDPVGVYTRQEAMAVGRLLDELHFVSFEDPIPTKDIDGLVELCQALDVPVVIGEFLTSPYNYGEYIRRRALDEVRFVVDNIGGISGGMKVAQLAEVFSMQCQPHNWGNAFDHAVHFHCELAMPNNQWFEMTAPQGSADRVYMKDHFRIAADGYVYAPTKPGLGYEMDRDALDRITKRIDK